MTPPVQTLAADSVRAALREVFAAREYDWVGRPGLLAWLREQYLRLLDWFARLEQTNPVLYFVLLAAMAAMLLAILAHFAYLLWRAWGYREAAAPGRPALGRPRDAAWYAARARELAAQGRYADALGHRFLALVLELEEGKLLTFHPSKTPAEYAREARLDPEARTVLAELVRALYGYLFGGAPAGGEAWLDFDRRAGELGSRVAAR
ncbi:MAG TPA: DUF4129 domain-containing protein [Gemmatimonadales bacterium]|nr:DUF4129 domain-containing protein [Gemmatimonadales bacterium]